MGDGPGTRSAEAPAEQLRALLGEVGGAMIEPSLLEPSKSMRRLGTDIREVASFSKTEFCAMDWIVRRTDPTTRRRGAGSVLLAGPTATAADAVHPIDTNKGIGTETEERNLEMFQIILIVNKATFATWTL